MLPLACLSLCGCVYYNSHILNTKIRLDSLCRCIGVGVCLFGCMPYASGGRGGGAEMWMFYISFTMKSLIGKYRNE